MWHSKSEFWIQKLIITCATPGLISSPHYIQNAISLQTINPMTWKFLGRSCHRHWKHCSGVQLSKLKCSLRFSKKHAHKISIMQWHKLTTLRILLDFGPSCTFNGAIFSSLIWTPWSNLDNVHSSTLCCPPCIAHLVLVQILSIWFIKWLQDSDNVCTQSAYLFKNNKGQLRINQLATTTLNKPLYSLSATHIGSNSNLGNSFFFLRISSLYPKTVQYEHDWFRFQFAQILFSSLIPQSFHAAT